MLGFHSFPSLRLVQWFPKASVSHISSSDGHTALVTSDGFAFAWGSGEDGQLGLGDLTHCARPQKIVFDSKARVKSCACGATSTAIVTGANSFPPKFPDVLPYQFPVPTN